MSRWYRTDEEQRGYDDRKEEGRYASYPYERSHDYRKGWEDAARDERLAMMRREEEEMERQAEERAAERRRQEYADMQRAEEEAFYQQEEPYPSENQPQNPDT